MQSIHSNLISSRLKKKVTTCLVMVEIDQRTISLQEFKACPRDHVSRIGFIKNNIS